MKCLSNKNNVQALKILITAEFSNVTLELEVVDVANANQEFPKHLPILVLDDGTQLFSSTQSCLYLFKDKLLNTSAVNQWLEWEAVKLLPNVLAFIDNPKQLSERLKSVLDVLNKSLQSTSFLVGESISVADISLWTTLHPALSDDKVKPMFANYTHVGSWYDNISKLTQVQKALKSWTDVLKGSTDTSLSEAFSSLSIVSNPSDNTVLSSLNKLATCSKKCNKPSQAESTAAVLEDDLSSKSKDVTTQEIEEAKAAWSGETPAPLRPRTVPVLPLPNENNILITSALPYVNNVPHLGNIIGCVLSADVFSRFCRLVNRNALYVSGTDEYGTATETKALEEGLTPRQICDKYFAIHDEVYKWFDIDFDYFGRTSTPEQTKIVQQVFSDVHKAEFTSTASVEQLHCGQCDRFLADRFVEGVCPKCRYEDARGDQCDGCGGLINAIELVQPRCKQCGQAPTIRSSTQLFLELPKIEENLQSWVSATSDQWSSNARVICKAWLKEGLKPRCITRDLKWGIPVPLPGFENKVFYVWFDAPIGYMSLTQSYCGQYEAWWKSTPNKNITLYQFMAKDNVPFHSIMFPATLVAAGDNYTKVNHIMATEYLNYEDGKFSKSRGTGVFGNNAKDTGLPADIFRFYLLYVRPENQDTSFSWQDLATKNNSELLNNLGNFINRALSFIDKNYGSTIPPMSLGHDDYLLLALINRETSAYYAGLDKAKLRDGIRYILNISRYSNQYMQANQPWVLYKGTDEQKSRASTVLGVLCQVAYLLSLLLSPYMPHTAATISEQLGANQLKYSLTDKPRLLCYLPPGHKIGTPAPLFRKIEQAQVDEWKVKYGGQQSKGPQSDKKTVATGQTGFKSVEECEKAVTDQGNLVRQVKSGGVSKAELAPHVERLLALKKQLELLKRKGGASEVSRNSGPAVLPYLLGKRMTPVVQNYVISSIAPLPFSVYCLNILCMEKLALYIYF
uniref:Methionine--tRNA ligase, cytoplasmic n=1 Tax=Cacopsylla melanoneura TaxID=428564 RepID=A0A8D8RIW0_9HEMI